MKRWIAWLLCLCLLLTGCTGGESKEEASAPGEYTGTLKTYTYLYPSGRDRKMEEDILYMAEVYLGNVYANGHPYLSDTLYYTMYSMDGKNGEATNSFDPQRREEFIRDINALIPRIDDLQTYEILFEMERIVAKLGDLHTCVYTQVDYWYPIWLEVFYVEGEAQFRAVVLPESRSSLLFSRLTAINGVPVEQVVEKLCAYCSYETIYAANENLTYMLTSSEALAVVGVAEKGRSAEFTLTDDSGASQTLKLPAMSQSSLSSRELVGQTWYDSNAPYLKDTDSYYWWEYQEENRLLYVRFNHIREDGNLVYSSFVKQLRQHIEAVPETQAVVLDLRDNPGGYFHASLSIYLGSFLNQLGDRQSYVLFRSDSYSSAIHLAGNLMQLTENTVFVGSPGGQPANFFGAVYDYTTPNYGFTFRMSDCYTVTNENDTNEALMPDVVIYQTVEDSRLGIDTVMQYILSQLQP